MSARVALVSTYYHPVIGGAEAAAGRLAGYLHGRGHPLFVITRRTSLDLAEHAVVEGVPVWRRPPVGGRSTAGKWWFLPALFAGLARRRREYDVICVVDQRATGLAALAASRLFGKPVVIQPQTQGTLDGRNPLRTGIAGLAHRIVTWPLRRCYVRADAIACIARAIEREGRTMGVGEGRLHYLPNPVDLARFAPLAADERRRVRGALGVGEATVVFAFTGRLSREKGVRELLEAWSRIAARERRLLLIGPDMPGDPWNEGEWARRFVADTGLGASVTLLGARPHAEVARLLGAADAAVLPSHFEAHPLAAVEAMACGLPIVASNVGGVPDFVIDGTNGLLVAARDVDGLAAALERMATDADFRRRAGTEARRAVEPFAADAVLGRFAALIDGLAARGAAGPRHRPRD